MQEILRTVVSKLLAGTSYVSRLLMPLLTVFLQA
jgi:hypothetical protein